MKSLPDLIYELSFELFQHLGGNINIAQRPVAIVGFYF
jgi:hypothetical protein